MTGKTFPSYLFAWPQLENIFPNHKYKDKNFFSTIMFSYGTKITIYLTYESLINCFVMIDE